MAKLSFYFLLLSICIACNETSIKKIKEQKINSAVTGSILRVKRSDSKDFKIGERLCLEQ